MSFLRGKDESVPDQAEEAWASLLHMSQLNTLSIAYMLLAIIEDPQVVSDDIRDQVLEMVTELEFGIARFEEFVV